MPEEEDYENTTAEIKKLRSLVKILADACDKVHQQAGIIQPFLGIWKKHGSDIEKYRKGGGINA